MNVLVVADAYPFPLQNGHALRIFHYTRLLKTRHTFDLVCFGEQAPPSELNALFRHISWFSRPETAPTRKPAWRRVAEAFSVDEMLISSPEMKAHLRDVVDQRHYDLIWGAGDAVMANVPGARKQPLLGDLVDDGVLASLREVARARDIKTALRKLKWAYLSALYERRYYGKAERCLVVSEIDASWFHRVCPGTPISVIHNGVDEQFFSPQEVRVDPLNLVFEGNLGFDPNHDGIVHFCKEILPLIQDSVPEATLTIVGKDPPADVRALASSTIEVTGYVDDIRPYLARGAVFVCPLRKGAGIKNKILQAWSMAKPVVATTTSVGGLKARDGANIIVRDTPTDFSAAVVELVNQPQLRASIGTAARNTILDHYTWTRKASELEALMIAMTAEY
jgi:glycosyltransferase involved in cell wall biosynthesis